MELFCRREFALKQFGDAALEPVQIQWLGEKIIGLHRHGAPGHLARQRAHENDGDFFGGRLAAQDFANGQAVKVGQQNIEQDQAGFELSGLAQCLHAVVRHDELAAQPGEVILHQLDKIALVVNDQNLRHHAASLSQRRAKSNGRPVKAR